MIGERQIRWILPEIWPSIFMHFQTVAAEHETDREKLSFWAEDTHSGACFQKQAEICREYHWSIVSYPKSWAQKSSYGFALCVWPWVSLGMWRTRIVRSWRVWQRWSLGQNGDTSYVLLNMLEFCLSWVETYYWAPQTFICHFRNSMFSKLE